MMFQVDVICVTSLMKAADSSFKLQKPLLSVKERLSSPRGGLKVGRATPVTLMLLPALQEITENQRLEINPHVYNIRKQPLLNLT